MEDNTPPKGAILVRRADDVAWITLNRPERLNAFAGTMRDDLHHAISDAAEDGSVRAVVVTGAGRAFCSGADVTVMAELLRQGDEDTFAGFMQAGMRVVRAIRGAPKPVIAAVNGAAAGAGASLALACDLRVASRAASIGITFGRIGLCPDWGSTYFLPRLVGPGRAAELILTARMVEAEEAERIGLFERVLPADRFAENVAEYVSRISRQTPLIAAYTKCDLAPDEERMVERAMEAEVRAQLRSFRSADAREGVAAFQEKRRPKFVGR